MPTHEEMQAAKSHLKDVDNAQETVMEAMFDDLRKNYEDKFSDFSKKRNKHQ